MRRDLWLPVESVDVAGASEEFLTMAQLDLPAAQVQFWRWWRQFPQRMSMSKHSLPTTALLAMTMLLYASRVSSGGEVLPADVKKLVDRREECNHWAGEEPYNKARSRQIDKAMNRLKCDSIAKEVQEMRAKYSGDAAVLTELPDMIE